MAAFLLFGRRVPRRTILELDLANGLGERPPDGLAARVLGPDRPTVRDAVDALERGAADERVRGLVVRIGPAEPGLARVEELRDAIRGFRAADKPALAFAESFGEFGGGERGYYLATACDEIWLQPSGGVGITGIAATVPFVRETFDRLGIEPRLDRREQYKTVVNSFTERGFTEPHRAVLRSLVASLFDRMLHEIADARTLPVERVAALVDRGPLPARTARAEGLVDRLAYRDEVNEALRTRTDGDATLLGHADYLKRAGRPARKGRDLIALIYGIGAVVRGESRWRPVRGAAMEADSIRAAFREAVGDRRVRAIVFRIDSPGGSYIASDAIRRVVARARAAGKPVVVSMGDVAASGGYFIALAADRIVAHPSTLTGSIGVAGGKLVTTEFWRRLGVRWGEVRAGEHAGMASPLRDYSESEWARVQEELDRIYADFVAKVAEARGIDLERARELARGRVWTGEQAHGFGLVDELGGLPLAFALAREAADLAPDARVRRRVYPQTPSLLGRLLGLKRSGASRGGLLDHRRHGLARAVLRLIRYASTSRSPAPGPAGDVRSPRMPPLQSRR
ncbi:MAG: signal peptide peptidase SppA [Gemmatimonadota bacterium]